MIILGETLLSGDLIFENFSCKISACKGACCREGDFGAPLQSSERETLLKEGAHFAKKYLNSESKDAIKKQGYSKYYSDMDEYGTPLRKDGACAYLSAKGDGIESCGIEKAWENGDLGMRKPISCHLYPIRILESPEYTSLNYDRWEICSDACEQGMELNMPLYLFLKDAIVRRFGEAYFNELDEMARELRAERGYGA